MSCGRRYNDCEGLLMGDLYKYIELGGMFIIATALVLVVKNTITQLLEQMGKANEKQVKQFIDAQERISSTLDTQLNQVAISQEKTATTLTLIADKLLDAALRTPQQKE